MAHARDRPPAVLLRMGRLGASPRVLLRVRVQTKMTTLAKRLKKARLEAGLTTRALSNIVGVSFSSISRLERGAGRPSIYTVERIERWLKDGSESEPVRRNLHEMSRIDKMELKLIHLDGMVNGLLNRLDRMTGGGE